MTPKYSSEMLPSGSKCEDALMHLTENIDVLDQLNSDISYAALGLEFSISDSTVY
jgi:hypothetical protein